MKTIISCASQTHKSTSNQDFCGIVINEVANFKGVIVADGIGSHLKSELSSKFCTKLLIEKLKHVISFDNADFDAFYDSIKDELKVYSKKELTEDELKNNPFGTTLICAIELENEYFFAYVGNGSIWHISGNFNHFGENRYLPWNVNNLLTPHTVEEDGKSALYKYISICDTVACKPSIIRVSKSEDFFGDIIIITTDGVFTNDEVKIGKDDNDVIWIMGEESMSILFKKLSTLFNNAPQYINEPDVQLMLNHYLSELKEKKIMHDDTTIGVIISPKVLQYQQITVDTLIKKTNETNTNS